MEREDPAKELPAYVSAPIREDKALPWGRITAVLIALTLLASCWWYYDSIAESAAPLFEVLGDNFWVFVLAGMVAQMIDGALGMAYGVSASTFLLSFGVSPAAANASIHTSEIFTSGVSGLMHLQFRNVNKKLFKTLLLPGVIGAALGALTLSFLEQYTTLLKPLIAVYTLYLGVRIIQKAYMRRKPK